MLKKVIAGMFLVLFLSVPARAEWSYLDKDTIFADPIAAARSPLLGFSVETFKYRENKTLCPVAALGGQVGIVSYLSRSFDVQLAMQAGGWFTFNKYTGTSFALLTEDFLFSLPLNLRVDKFSASVRWSHISAHLGDGMGKFLREVNANPREDIIYSRDFVTILLSQEFEVDGREVRTYAQVVYVYRIFPESTRKWIGGGGLEVLFRWDGNAMFSAVDVVVDQFADSVNISSKLGWLERPREGSWGLRVFVVGYAGKDNRGQLWSKKAEQIGVGFSLF